MKGVYFSIIAVLFFTNMSYGETVYFLVAEQIPTHGDSYVVPISQPADIAHARDLITFGPSIGETIVCADVACGADGINRDHYAPDKRAWNWHVTLFTGFAEITAEILDGYPGQVEADCSGWGSGIGFWGYTIVKELGTYPNMVQCNFDHVSLVNLADFALFALQWFRSDCADPLWCEGADTDQSGTVDLTDLQYCVGFWIMWFDAWECPTQCYGNADCITQNNYPVDIDDYTIWLNVWGGANWPAYCGDLNYDPRADFDRDCDVDDDDGTILFAWLDVEESQVPTNCPTAP